MAANYPDLKIGVVGPCAAGKSTLISSLKRIGIHAYHIAQEHSFVPDMWLRLVNPQVLIFLEVSYPVTIIRCSLSWMESEYDEQIRRLQHARQHADLIISTDPLSPDQVLDRVLRFIEQT
jgi:energy-coupling factor transporter ATP-binding protein EcfA2